MYADKDVVLIRSTQQSVEARYLRKTNSATQAESSEPVTHLKIKKVTPRQ
jgi:hypothetical protein